MSREKLTPAESFSGSLIERVRLRDGTRLVVKHLPADGDWFTRTLHSAGRIQRMWESGLLHRVAEVVDHTMVDVTHESVVMRDVGSELLPATGPVSRETSRRLLAGAAAMHAAFEGETADGLCTIGDRYAMFALDFHASDKGPNAHPMQARIKRGWEIFAETTDADVVAAVFSVHRDPARTNASFERFRPTLLHGDLKVDNLGLRDGALVAVDWGDMTGIGPREVDVAWYALKNTIRTGGSPSDVFEDYEAVSGRKLDRDALDLACIGSLAQQGFRMAISAAGDGPEPPELAGALLRWWTQRAAEALDGL